MKHGFTQCCEPQVLVLSADTFRSRLTDLNLLSDWTRRCTACDRWRFLARRVNIWLHLSHTWSGQSYQEDSWTEGITVRSFNVSLLTLTVCGSSAAETERRKKNFPSVLFFLINITFPQVRIKKKVFVIAVQIQFQIELFFSRAGAFCHMLTFYHWCHLDSFPWQCSDGRLLTHAEREENPYSTTCCLSVWQSSALTT